MTECGHDVKALYKIIDNLTMTDNKQKLPKTRKIEKLPTHFMDFFEEKIKDIRRNFQIMSSTTYPERNDEQCLYVLDPATDAEIYSIVMKSPNKSCDLDPIPTWLLKCCIEELLPVITTLVNSSLATGCFPEPFKEAIIRPLLKKQNLDVEQFKNYRPVSNLHFVSKIIEKVVLVRLENHILKADLHVHVQSAYRKLHSTETALLKISNDVLSSIDTKQCMILASLDFSAAFDTVDHSLLEQKLEYEFGIKGSALQWFKSYLHNRKQRVSIK